MPLRTLADKIELGQPSRGWPWQEAGIEREAKTCRQFITGLTSREEDAAAPASELNRSCRPGERFGDSTPVRDSEIIDRRLAPRRERVTRKPSLILPDRGDQNWLWKRSRLHGQVDSFRIADHPARTGFPESDFQPAAQSNPRKCAFLVKLSRAYGLPELTEAAEAALPSRLRRRPDRRRRSELLSSRRRNRGTDGGRKWHIVMDEETDFSSSRRG